LAGHCGICGGQSDTGTIILQVFKFYPVSIIPPEFHILEHFRAAISLAVDTTINKNAQNGLV